NNNIIWNVGHIFAAQQNVCYVRIGLSPAIPLDTYSKFLPGTRPEQFIESDVKEDIVALMSTTLDLLERDCQKNVFENFTPWTTRSGFPINSINDALIYLHFHEGMHTGKRRAEGDIFEVVVDVNTDVPQTGKADPGF